jgi:alpha-amylase
MSKKQICLYLHVHQPYRLTKLNYLDLGQLNDYFLGTGEGSNENILKKVASKSYLPTNKVLLKLLKKHPEFKLTLSITGTVIEQFQEFAPKVLKSFQELVATGRVEILAETYYHSLASIYSLQEFCEQVEQHRDLVQQVFGVKPISFRNTELVYNDRIASVVHQLGFKAIVTEGWDPILEWRSSNHIYRANLPELTKQEKKLIADYKIRNKPYKELKLLLKNYKLSDDIAFRFSDKNWQEYPLTVSKYLSWLNATEGNIINLFMDYETFGEHQWEDTGIFKLLEKLPAQALKDGFEFTTVSEAADAKAEDTVAVEGLISWADMERDLSAWNGNKMQQTALTGVYALEKAMRSELQSIKGPMRDFIVDQWRRLQTSDHFYYMSTKYWNDGDVHKYFSPYESPYEAFINYMNILEDFQQRLDYELQHHA